MFRAGAIYFEPSIYATVENIFKSIYNYIINRIILTIYGKYKDMVSELWYHRDLNLLNKLRIHLLHLLKHPLYIQKKEEKKQIFDAFLSLLSAAFEYCIPLYESRGFVRHITKWHSISSGKTNLLHTGHLIPSKWEAFNFYTTKMYTNFVFFITMSTRLCRHPWRRSSIIIC